MGTHTSQRGVKPLPVLMDIPAGIDLFVQDRFGPVGTLPVEFQRIVYRYRRGGRFERLGMVEGFLKVVDGYQRRVYVEWKHCKRANVTTTFV